MPGGPMSTRGVLHPLGEEGGSVATLVFPSWLLTLPTKTHDAYADSTKGRSQVPGTGEGALGGHVQQL